MIYDLMTEKIKNKKKTQTEKKRLLIQYNPEKYWQHTPIKNVIISVNVKPIKENISNSTFFVSTPETQYNVTDQNISPCYFEGIAPIKWGFPQKTSPSVSIPYTDTKKDISYYSGVQHVSFQEHFIHTS